MKLAALYSVFNGEELLKQSIEQIYDSVDEIVICYQSISNKGFLSKNIESFVHDLQTEYLEVGKPSKIHLNMFLPNLDINTKENERRKHQFMIEKARKLSCSHFFMAACDHFYIKEQFNYAKDYVERKDPNMTITAMYTYYKHPTWRLTPVESYFMPFICKLLPESKISVERNFPLRVDPSVQINTWNKYKLFSENEIMLHHFSMIRKDIRDKFKNAAASIRWTKEQVNEFISEYENAKVGDKIKYFQGRQIVEVPDYFGLNIETKIAE